MEIDPSIPAPIVTSVDAVPTENDPLATNKGLAVGRTFYFVFFFALSGFGAFTNLYFTSLGIRPAELGVIGFVSSIVAMVATPLWSAAADMRQSHKSLLIVATVVTGISSLLFLGVNGFLTALAVSIFVSVFRSPIFVVLETSVVALVNKSGRSYPRQRVWGSIGFAVGSFVSGWLVARAGYAPIYWIQFIGFGIAGAVLALMLPIERSTERVDYVGGLRVLMAKRQYVGVIVFMLSLGYMTATFLSYGGLFLVALGGAATLIGIMYSIGPILEIPAILSGGVVSRRIGRQRTVALSGLGVGISFAIGSFATEPWQFMAAVAFTGLFNGVIFSAITPLAIESAPPQLRASAVGIMLAAFGGAGFAIGILVSGLILDAVGGGANFLTAAVLMLLGTAYFYYATRK